MKRRGRIQRVAKWAGVVVCAVIGGAWVISALGWGATAIYDYPKGRNIQVRLYAGSWGVLVGESAIAPDLVVAWYGYQLHRARWLPSLDTDRDSLVMRLWVPLWMPFVAVAAPTAWFFWRNRVRSGHCQCGYSLIGLTAGSACPECGKATA